ncbi:MAG: nitrate ABC transporter ATP-binding protein [Geitlerinemataceae cyanobacterium]
MTSQSESLGTPPKGEYCKLPQSLPLLDVDHVSRVFDLPDGGQYIALTNIDVTIEQGEFITLLGHSGCGKSTLLNIIAGLDRPTEGGIVVEGAQVTEPGPDRMVVFQNYSLLPWKTVRENIALAVDTVFKDMSKAERSDIVEEHVDMVGLRRAADNYPSQISGGMKQRVAIARAFSIRPKVLLLDEPFGALDALTRGGLQEQLMNICQENKVTAIMVTHDVDEALLLSDRIVMLTTGPSAHVGQILDVPIPRPRNRMDVVNHPSYYTLRNEVTYFLNQQKRGKKKKKKKVAAPAIASPEGLEKAVLDVGFIPLTDCAPLAVAKEKGLFAEYGLDVTLNRQPNWNALAESVATGELDAGQMVAGMPLAMTLGMRGKSSVPICSSMVLSRNGNAITWSKQLTDNGITNLATLKDYIARDADRVYNFGMVHPASMHNLVLRNWLASGGIDPDWDVSLCVVPPPLMVANLKQGNIEGYCVGEPWNSRAVSEGLGTVVATDLDLFPGHIEKVLGVREDWAEKHPKTHVALVKALLDACEYCDDPRNREEILGFLQKEEYLGDSGRFAAAGFQTPYDRGDGTTPESHAAFNQFFLNRCNAPDSVHSLWTLAQMARWDLTPFPKNWVETIARVNRADVFADAASALTLPRSPRDRQPIEFPDGTTFDPDSPIDYLKALEIKRDVVIREMPIGVTP